jgi:hypothetical protein
VRSGFAAAHAHIIESPSTYSGTHSQAVPALGFEPTRRNREQGKDSGVRSTVADRTPINASNRSDSRRLPDANALSQQSAGVPSRDGPRHPIEARQRQDTPKVAIRAGNRS